ncbi:MAG: hypothetical protein RO009_13520 [Pseudorhodoplanes sp.]|jgi:hypothetical protein|nr:hypothetical protein [Pseudorhodoplanes sp.]
MWPLLLGLWKARCGRKAAVAAIAPLVARSRQRLSDIPDTAWLDPYLVGFMMMFITLVARREVNALDTQALGLVQCSAWGEITGMKPDLIGEETLHLCTTGDRDFERGCRDAIAIDLELYRNVAELNADLGFGSPYDGFGFDMSERRESDGVMPLWEHYFDERVMTHAAAHGGLAGRTIDMVRAAT